MTFKMKFERESHNESFNRTHKGWVAPSGSKSFQAMLYGRMRKFEDYAATTKKLRSGMTLWEEYMFGLGIRKGSEKSIQRRLKKGGFKLFYDPSTSEWTVRCELHEIEAVPILVPDLLWTKVMALGYLP